jgi:hypothetical protein
MTAKGGEQKTSSAVIAKTNTVTSSAIFLVFLFWILRKKNLRPVSTYVGISIDSTGLKKEVFLKRTEHSQVKSLTGAQHTLGSDILVE